jgi:hypothetical protein
VQVFNAHADAAGDGVVCLSNPESVYRRVSSQ